MFSKPCRFCPGLTFVLTLLLANVPNALAVEGFRVLEEGESPSPADGTKDVELQAVIRLQFSEPLDPKTLTPQSFQLFGPDSNPVPAYLQTDLTGGVATLAPTRNLQPKKTYTVRVSPDLKSARGEPIEPFSIRFQTTGQGPAPDPIFQFRAHKIDDRKSNCAMAIGPDGNLYVANTYGETKRYQLDPETGKPTGTDVPFENDGDQVVSITFDPEATAENLVTWLSLARYGENYSGTIARVVFPAFGEKSQAERTVVIIGLPHDDLLHHQPNGLAFGPDGRLYQSIGGTATLGGNPNWGMKETPLSASVIVADVRNPDFNGGELPCNVQTAPPVNYDPFADDAPVRIFATGFRNAYDLAWHSTGYLFTATNQNSISSGVQTPASPDGKIPAINAMPFEMLYRVEEGKYYGHPNPTRGEYVLNGGNPTEDIDPFEVPEYPVGVEPLENFEPRLIYNLRPGGGNSANGMDEYRAPGPLQGRLLIAYFSGAKCVQSFAIDPDGKIVQEHPLLNENGDVIRFRGAIDVAVHPESGRVYVADFGDWERPHHGHQGAVWMLEPISTP